MPRRKKQAAGASKVPPWLITFSDLMTLLLTFFVLLVSMAAIDERSKRDVLGSVARQFGFGEVILNPTAPPGMLGPVEPGRMDLPEDDLEPLRDRVFDDSTKDLSFQENKYVQIFSISDEVLFRPGSTELSEKGMTMLDRLMPYLQRIEYPLLVAGHAGIPRDEEGRRYTVDLDTAKLDNTWLLSFRRAMSVYRYLAAQGLAPQRLSLEAFGQYRARFTNNTPEGRSKNRRVDLVLDRRNKEWIDKVEQQRDTQPPEITKYTFQGFNFDLNIPGSR